MNATTYQFSPREFARLYLYRMAVRAGYYTDYLGVGYSAPAASPTDTDVCPICHQKVAAGVLH